MRYLSLSFAVALCACAEAPSPSPLRIAAEPIEVAAEEPSPARPWGVRFVRQCSEWSGGSLIATSRALVACGGLVYGDDGSLRAVMPHSELVAEQSERSLWHEYGESSRCVIRDGSLREIGNFEALGAPCRDHRGSLSEDGRAIVDDGAGLYDLDLVARTARRLEPSEQTDPCTFAQAMGLTEAGAIQCIAREDERTYFLHTVGGARVELPAAVRSGVHEPRGHRWLVATDDRAFWIGEDGAILAERPIDARFDLLARSPRGEVLVSFEDRTELWSYAHGRTIAERVHDGGASQGAFLGEHIVLMDRNDDVLWLARGASMPVMQSVTSTPPGFTAMRADGATFRSEHSEYTRSRSDLGAFEGVDGWLFVSHVDAVELSRFTGDDETWAQMIAARYLDEGQHRWAAWWREEEGRVVRGHVYIGGCERSDVDVLVREHEDGSLERRVLTSSENPERVLGAIPRGAHRFAESDRYAGDPSIGRAD